MTQVVLKTKILRNPVKNDYDVVLELTGLQDFAKANDVETTLTHLVLERWLKPGTVYEDIIVWDKEAKKALDAS